MLPVDPIAIAVFVIGVFICFAVKGSGESLKSHKDKSIYDIYKDIGEQSSEYKRYQERLSESQ
jgi:hypothetical protein